MAESDEFADSLQKLDEEIIWMNIGGMDGILNELNTSLSNGLTSDAVGAMRARFGSNEFREKPRKTFLSHFLETFEDATLIILLVSAVVSLGFASVSGAASDFANGAAIVVAVVVVSLVTAVQNWQQDKEFAVLSRLKGDRDVQVVRGGAARLVPVAEVVVGDVVHFEAGDSLPADGVLAQGFHVACDESSLTGETSLARKEAGVFPGCVLHGSSTVQEGTGTMVVTGVGARSAVGRMLELAEEGGPKQTPLQAQLEHLAEQIGYMGLFFAVLTFLALFLSWFLFETDAVLASPSASQSLLQELRDLPPGLSLQRLWLLLRPEALALRDWAEVMEAFLVAVTIVVVAVPEGLPLAVTVSLAFSIRKMLADHSLVRNLAACETMGSATVIASDKTGTLTQNRMTVVAFWTPHSGRVPTLDAARTALGPNLQAFASAAAANSSLATHIEDMDASRPRFVGSQTEASLLYFVHRSLGTDPLALRRSLAGQVKFQQPFSSTTKLMLTVLQSPKTPTSPASKTSKPSTSSSSSFRVLCKGAPEVVVERCVGVLGRDGAVEPLDKSKVLRTVAGLAETGLRTLAIAEKSVVGEEDWEAEADGDRLAKGLHLMAIVGIKDPVREEVPGAVAACTKAGVRVVMVTGDNLRTARYIARECGILDPKGTGWAEEEEEEGGGEVGGGSGSGSGGGLEPHTPAVLSDIDLTSERSLERILRSAAREGGVCCTGAEFRNLSPEHRVLVARQLSVMARSLPADKHALVSTLMEDGEVVAVTGDGTNDAPALSVANVGLSMGLTGTEVAKEASDIQILDDNFRSIVLAIRWGRSIKENVRKFLQMQLSINVAALVVTFVAAVVGARSNAADEALPFSPLSMLFLNLFMDSLAALALATEPPREELMDRVPEGKSTALISPHMWFHILGHAAFQSVILLVLMFSQWGADFFDAPMVGSLPEEDPRSRLMPTCIFATFVLLNAFNLLNARKVHGRELNVFAGFFDSAIGPIVLILVILGMVAIVEWGGAMAQTHPLTQEQWGKAVAIALLSFPVGALLRLIRLPSDAEEEKHEQETRQSVDPAALARVASTESADKVHLEMEQSRDQAESRASSVRRRGRNSRTVRE